MQVRPVEVGERDRLLEIAVSTQLFEAAEAEALLGGVLDELAAGTLPAGHQTLAVRDGPGRPCVAWSYFAPDAHAEGVWNVWWIGADPRHHGSGAAIQLLEEIERIVVEASGRLVVIETGAGEALARARRFYARSGYMECGRVPHFYGVGETKVIFAKALALT